MKGFKDIKGYEGLYKINNKGEVYSYYRNIIIKNQLQNTGYMSIILCKDTNKKLHLIHRLVASAFIDNIQIKPCVNHIDGDKTNNNLNNLEWVTYSENRQHALDNGLWTIRKGKDHPLYGRVPHNKGNSSKITKSCLNCSSDFKTYKSETKFCSRKCSAIHRENERKNNRYEK